MSILSIAYLKDGIIMSSDCRGTFSKEINGVMEYASLAAWVSENGYEFAGPMIDVYHVSPNDTRNPDEFVTEICCPIRLV